LLINVVLITPFFQIWSPMMLEYRTKTNIQKLFADVFFYFMMIGGLIVAAGSLFAQEILTLLIRGEVNNTTTYVYITCMIGLLLISTVNFFSAGLIYSRKIYILSYAYYVVALLKLCINMILIPLFGLFGAMASIVFSSIALPFGMYALSKKYFQFRVDWVRIFILAGLILPCIIYGFYSVKYSQVYIVWRIIWLFLTLMLVFRLCITKTVRFEIFRILKIGKKLIFLQ
jgi:O-antigen/teichoic acid export membrane protein